MSGQDFDKWQARYAQPSFHSGPPVPFVVRAIAEVPAAGRGLDLAGGLGRHALEMAARGFETTLLDVSPTGLDRARAAAEARGLHLRTVAADLDEAPVPAGPFNLVVVSWFLLTESMWDGAARALAPGGRLVYVQPTLHNQERHAHPSPRFLVAPGALRAAAEARGLEVLVHEEGWDETNHHTTRLVARRPG